MGFFPSIGSVTTTVWMHHMDTNKTHIEITRWELYQKATSYFEKMREGKPHKTAVVRPLSSYLKTHPSKICWRSKNELISDVLLKTTTIDMPMLADQQEFIYISSVRTQDIVWRTCLEWWMRGTDGERESGKSMLSARLDDDHDNHVN